MIFHAEEQEYPRRVPDVGDTDIVQVLMTRELSRLFEQRCLPDGRLVGPLLFSEDDIPTFIIESKRGTS